MTYAIVLLMLSLCLHNARICCCFVVVVFFFGGGGARGVEEGGGVLCYLKRNNGTTLFASQFQLSEHHHTGKGTQVM